jgi:hypothetical protein
VYELLLKLATEDGCRVIDVKVEPTSLGVDSAMVGLVVDRYEVALVKVEREDFPVGAGLSSSDVLSNVLLAKEDLGEVGRFLLNLAIELGVELKSSLIVDCLIWADVIQLPVLQVSLDVETLRPADLLGRVVAWEAKLGVNKVEAWVLLVSDAQE